MLLQADHTLRVSAHVQHRRTAFACSWTSAALYGLPRILCSLGLSYIVLPCTACPWSFKAWPVLLQELDPTRPPPKLVTHSH